MQWVPACRLSGLHCMSDARRTEQAASTAGGCVSVPRSATAAATDAPSMCAAGPPLPLLHSSPTEGHADITWPDFAYIGSEDGRLPDLHRGDSSHFVHRVS